MSNRISCRHLLVVIMLGMMMIAVSLGISTVNANAAEDKNLDNYDISITPNSVTYRSADWFDLTYDDIIQVKYDGVDVAVRYDYHDDQYEWCYVRTSDNEPMFRVELDSYDVGDRTMEFIGIGEYTGSVKLPVTITQYEATSKQISIWNVCMNQGLVYNGEYRKPTIAVSFCLHPDSEGESWSQSLVEGKDYDLVEQKYSHNKSVGKASVKMVIRLKGNFATSTGEDLTKTAKFNIKPRKPVIKKKASTKNSITIKWKKPKYKVSGYKIVYGYYKYPKNYVPAEDGDEDEGIFVKRTKYVKSSKATSVTLKKLKKNENYHITIKAYKVSKADGKKYYSNSTQTWKQTKKK